MFFSKQVMSCEQPIDEHLDLPRVDRGALTRKGCITKPRLKKSDTKIGGGVRHLARQGLYRSLKNSCYPLF